MSFSDFVSVANNYVENVWDIIKFLFTLPQLFSHWFILLPTFFQIGFSFVAICSVAVLILKLKTWILF